MTKLKQFRVTEGLSQEKMARKLNITLSYYSQIERGYIPASRAFMVLMKRHFPSIDINDIFFNDEVLDQLVK